MSKNVEVYKTVCGTYGSFSRILAIPTLIFQPPLKLFTSADPSVGANPAASMTLSTFNK